MMNAWYINFFFDGINLAIVIALVGYIIKKYVIGHIQQALLAQKQHKALLEQQEQNWLLQYRSMSEAVQQQEDDYGKLHAKFVAWQQSVQTQIDQDREEYGQQLQKMQDLLKRKQQYLEHRYLIERELPEILEQSEHQLKMKFKNDKNLGKAYLSKIVQALDE